MPHGYFSYYNLISNLLSSLQKKGLKKEGLQKLGNADELPKEVVTISGREAGDEWAS